MSRQHARLNKRLWEQTRLQVFQRDDYRCRTCGRAGALECDHVESLQSQPDQDVYSLDGLQTLCRFCHIEKTRLEARRVPTPEEQVWHDMVAEMMD